MFVVAITARNATEVVETTKEVQELFPKVKVVGVPADGCKLDELEALVKKVCGRSWESHVGFC